MPASDVPPITPALRATGGLGGVGWAAWLAPAPPPAGAAVAVARGGAAAPAPLGAGAGPLQADTRTDASAGIRLPSRRCRPMVRSLCMRLAASRPIGAQHAEGELREAVVDDL